MLAYFLFFISLKYLFPFIFYLSGGKTYQPVLVLIKSSNTTKYVSLLALKDLMMVR